MRFSLAEARSDKDDKKILWSMQLKDMLDIKINNNNMMVVTFTQNLKDNPTKPTRIELQCSYAPDIKDLVHDYLVAQKKRVGQKHRLREEQII